MVDRVPLPHHTLAVGLEEGEVEKLGVAVEKGEVEGEGVVVGVRVPPPPPTPPTADPEREMEGEEDRVGVLLGDADLEGEVVVLGHRVVDTLAVNAEEIEGVGVGEPEGDREVLGLPLPVLEWEGVAEEEGQAELVREMEGEAEREGWLALCDKLTVADRLERAVGEVEVEGETVGVEEGEEALEGGMV